MLPGLIIAGVAIVIGRAAWLGVRESFWDCPRVRNIWNTCIAPFEALEYRLRNGEWESDEDRAERSAARVRRAHIEEIKEESQEVLAPIQQRHEQQRPEIEAIRETKALKAGSAAALLAQQERARLFSARTSR